MTNAEHWTVDTGRVIWEVLDGEAVIVDLASGRYHAASGVTLTVWEALAGGADLTATTTLVAATHPGTPDDAREHIAAFVDDLVTQGLLTPAPAPATPAVRPEVATATAPASWAPPALESYEDLEDLLLLDPVHEVTPDGWPHAGPPTP